MIKIDGVPIGVSKKGQQGGQIMPSMIANQGK